MPLTEYGVLVGRVRDRRREGGKNSPHYQIHVDAAGTQFRVAVNVLSALAPSELLYTADEDFTHPVLPALATLTDGFTPLTSTPGGLALDFIRGNLFDRTTLRTMPADQPGPDNDLADKLDHYIQHAVGDPAARLYAFGQRWGPETAPDKIFGFAPGNGIHDIHMNQGNTGRFTADDGVWQDGALILSFPDRWIAVFLAFQSQAWHTDDTTGHTLPGIPPADPDGHPAPGEPDRQVRIIAALVNPTGPAPEAETVTLLNTTASPIDLTGWTLLDRAQHQAPLPTLTLPAGDTVRLPIPTPLALGNQGGALTLLNAAGLKVDGVAYTTAPEGRTLTF
ncbi:hypothetical protein CC117_25555 [Parafrankia colletiae]|uniref:LTD domain-containing protein n=1 Tax=Parafrankia colletiae TaxID=573497 RepID=A0A1S1QD63_9ACTN|nr:DUF2278 family protein [Parafrankia colletiae]MCK9905162.1 DUF2278 family protein [Frankia sp. Cpl3]OHV31587.1 hypothetical protein CC117_25555 [Parafrankia colletiae]